MLGRIIKIIIYNLSLNYKFKSYNFARDLNSSTKRRLVTHPGGGYPHTKQYIRWGDFSTGPEDPTSLETGSSLQKSSFLGVFVNLAIPQNRIPNYNLNLKLKS